MNGLEIESAEDDLDLLLKELEVDLGTIAGYFPGVRNPLGLGVDCRVLGHHIPLKIGILLFAQEFELAVDQLASFMLDILSIEGRID